MTTENEFRWSSRVYYEDTDAAGIVYHANYLKYMERARTEWLRGIGFDQHKLAAELGIGFVVRRMTIDFIRPARLDEVVEVVSSIERHGRASIVFDQSVVDPDGEVLCRAEVKVGCVDLADKRPLAMPPTVYAGECGAS